LGAILAFLKSLYEYKEKVVLGLLIVAFVSMAVVQVRLKKKSEASGNSGKNPDELISDGWKPAPPRTATQYDVPMLTNPYPLERYYKLLGQKNIFGKPAKDLGKGRGPERTEWLNIRVKSVFDPTQTGNYIAIIEVDKKSRIVKEGQQFEGYEVKRIDGVRSCLTMSWRELDEEREFCKEE